MTKAARNIAFFTLVIVLFAGALVTAIYWRSEDTVVLEKSPDGPTTHGIEAHTKDRIIDLITNSYGREAANSIVSITWQNESNQYVVLLAQEMPKREFRLLGYNYYIVDAAITQVKGGSRD